MDTRTRARASNPIAIATLPGQGDRFDESSSTSPNAMQTERTGLQAFTEAIRSDDWKRPKASDAEDRRKVELGARRPATRPGADLIQLLKICPSGHGLTILPSVPLPSSPAAA
jgi:hypothetical protein